MTREWDAEAYHRLSAVQTSWGEAVLERIGLRGDETALDAGCGTGRLTEKLAERLPEGHVIALDNSEQMLDTARRHLARFGDRISFVRADLADLDLADAVDLVFSTATFHWVTDHPRLFRRLYRGLRSGGRLEAQCGGAQNIRGLMERAHLVMARPPYAVHFQGYRDPWEFADAPTTASRLTAAGFADVQTDLFAAPAVFDDERTYLDFLEKVILRHHLERLPPALWAPVLEEVMARVPRPLVIDYWRLNLSGRKILTREAS